MYVSGTIFFFSRDTKLSSSGRGSFLALSAAKHAGGPRIHHGGSADPGQDLWRMIWAFNSRNLAITHEVRKACAQPENQAGPWNPKLSFFHSRPLSLFLKCRNNPQRPGGYSSTTAALNAFPFVRSMNGVVTRVLERACACDRGERCNLNASLFYLLCYLGCAICPSCCVRNSTTLL